MGRAGEDPGASIAGDKDVEAMTEEDSAFEGGEFEQGRIGSRDGESWIHWDAMKRSADVAIQARSPTLDSRVPTHSEGLRVLE